MAVKPTDTRARVLRVLADGKLHSGADIGKKIGVSRAAVCKVVGALAEIGLPVESIGGRGYQLDAPLTLLDRKHIAKHLRSAVSVKNIEILSDVGSTNRHLLDRAAQLGAANQINGEVCLAEAQPKGRGRRGRAWVATPYSNLMLSMSWRFSSGAATLSGLSLAAGVAVVRALSRYGVNDVGLKWPNDVLWNERKLAGLLVDVNGEATGPCTVVLGVGINCRIAPKDGAHIDQAWTDLATITGQMIDRNRLAAYLIEELLDMFRGFADRGLSAFRAQWEKHHIFTGRAVRILQGEATFDGTVEGVDDNGALSVRDPQGRRQLFHSGEVSVRTSVHESADRSR